MLVLYAIRMRNMNKLPFLLKVKGIFGPRRTLSTPRDYSLITKGLKILVFCVKICKFLNKIVSLFLNLSFFFDQ